MKWQKHLLILFVSAVLVACSDSSNDDPTPSSQAANTNTPAPATETLTSDAKEKRSDAATQRLKGTVRSMTEIIYPGEKTDKYSTKNVFHYDENGNRTELINYKADGSLNSTIKSAYDAAGKVVSEETVLGNGVVDIKSVIKTDIKGNRVEQTDLKQNAGSNDLFNYKYLYKYDAEAHLIERVGYRGNGSFFLKYTFNYDANGNRTDWLQLSESNLIIAKTSYKYDDKNNIIEENKHNPDGSVKETYTYTYEFDKKGNWVRQKKMKNGAVVELRVREYKYF